MRPVVLAGALVILSAASSLSAQDAYPADADMKRGVVKAVAIDHVEVEGVGKVPLLGVEFIKEEPECSPNDIVAVLQPSVGQSVVLVPDRQAFERSVRDAYHLRLEDGRFLNDLPLTTGCARMRSYPGFSLARAPWMTTVWQTAQMMNRKYYRIRAATGVAAPAAPATSSTPPAGTPPGSATAFGVYRAKCASEWPDDFRMRAYCEEQQSESYKKLQQRVMVGGDRETIRAKCASEWPDDFRMRNYCEEQQLEALRKLGRM